MLAGGLAAASLLLAGCFHSEPALPPAPPAVSEPVLVLTPPPPVMLPPAPPAAPTVAASQPSPHKPQPRRHLPARHHYAPHPAAPLPPAPKPAAPPPPLDLSAGLSPQQQIAYRRDAVAWLAASRNQLAAVARRHFNAIGEADRLQAKDYVRQAERALAHGDVVSARSLAYKAMLLAQALH